MSDTASGVPTFKTKYIYVELRSTRSKPKEAHRKAHLGTQVGTPSGTNRQRENGPNHAQVENVHRGLPVSDPVGKHRPGLRVAIWHRGHPDHPEGADGIEKPQELEGPK